MKNVARGTLTVVALTAILGFTGCTPPPPAPSPESSASASAAPVRAEGFSSTLPIIKKVPDDWKKGAALQAEVAFTLGNHVGYVAAAKEVQPSTSISESQLTTAASRKLFVVDSKGDVVYVSKEPQEGTLNSLSDLKRVTANGSPYLVFVQSVTVMKGVTPSQNDEVLTSVTIINDQGKETSYQKVDGYDKIRIINDAVVVVSEDEKPEQIIDVVTGKLSALPSAPQGSEWYGRFDGVDVFGQVAFGGFSNQGKLTDGNWSSPTKTQGSKSYEPIPFGSLVKVARPSFSMNVAYDLLDPHTGKTVYGSDLPEGLPFSSEISSNSNNSDAYDSPNRKFVVTEVKDKASDALTSGVFSTADSKYYPMPAGFTAKSVTNDGFVYGVTKDGKFSAFNVVKDKEPQAVADALTIPSQVSDTGIAIFKENGKSFVVLKSLG